jgi:hypothetical protein
MKKELLLKKHTKATFVYPVELGFGSSLTKDFIKLFACYNLS